MTECIEYIEREKARATTDRHIQEHEGGYDCAMEFAIGWVQALEAVSNDIEELPAADVRPERHGEWSEEEFDCDFSEVSAKIKTICLFKCSLCGHMSLEQCANYCHHCGAKMDGGDGSDSLLEAIEKSCEKKGCD